MMTTDNNDKTKTARNPNIFANLNPLGDLRLRIILTSAYVLPQSRLLYRHPEISIKSSVVHRQLMEEYSL